MTDQEVEQALEQLRTAREQAQAYRSLAERLENKLHDAGISFCVHAVGATWERRAPRQEGVMHDKTGT
jgi:hypothetical protein